ncbi:ATP12 ATPase family protein [Stachybotrys elegans]|uniref:ATP12 ATPase family protein n=1 Tax=Stachybotrys elegans TaxID=80388 RepID=A0A8K0WK85_9HYPO|nr:ATP12 ATPase family protein [Stachybotrys elegans]
MNSTSQLALRLQSRVAAAPKLLRPIHTTALRAANVGTTVGAGPPPKPPVPEAGAVHERVARRRKQAEMLKNARDIRSAQSNKSSGLKRRFWKDVSVVVNDGALQVNLDSRPLRHPLTKEVIRLPVSKQNLATALAFEWDVLSSAQQATKQHLIPLTSLICRGIDIMADDAAATPEASKIRTTIAAALLRYLDTDSLLCWAPPAGEHDLINEAGESLRDVQKRTADDISSFMTTHVWPGIRIEPVLDGHSIFPKTQAEGVREVIQGWIAGLDAWEIAGLERAVLAGKSLVVAARFIAEWSEGQAGVRRTDAGDVFTIEHAAKATNLEVDWQAQQWGEVDDTHDVNREDVRRQLGSVLLLISGTKQSS